MKILIAGEDRTRDLAAQVALDATCKPRRAPRFMSPQHSALMLGTARDTAEYQDILTRLLWIRGRVPPTYFEASGKWRVSRFIKAKWQGLLWSVLGFLQEKVVFQQNVVNEIVIGALEYEREQHRLETAELRTRLEVLERGRGDAA